MGVLLAVPVSFIAVGASRFWRSTEQGGARASLKSSITISPKDSKQGSAEAQFNLGVSYSNDNGVPKDAAEASRWYLRAAEQGFAAAQFSLGVAYSLGDGVPKDPAEAARWFLRAAEQGHPDAQFNLGVSYDIGNGVPKDPTEAARWFLRAAEQSHSKAQLNIAMAFYNRGELNESVAWFSRAAANGSADAHIYLGSAKFHRWISSISGTGSSFILNVDLRDIRVRAESDIFFAYTHAPRGGFGRVIVGVHFPTGLPVAVKVIDASRTRPVDFARETMLYRAISMHITAAMKADSSSSTRSCQGWKYVNVIYGSGWEGNLQTVDPRLPANGACLLMMEPLQESLSDRHRRCGSHWRTVDIARVLYECALGLSFLASCHIVHGDVKVGNIMFHSDKRAVLCDFGMGRITSSHAAASSLPIRAVRGGTVAYLAPELLGGSKRASTAATDVYALGCVGYCLLAGIPHPWHGITSDVSAIEARVCHGDRPSLTSGSLSETPELLDWIDRCWAHDALARPTALQAAEELRRAFPGVGDDTGGILCSVVESPPASSESRDEYVALESVVASSRAAPSTTVSENSEGLPLADLPLPPPSFFESPSHSALCSPSPHHSSVSRSRRVISPATDCDFSLS